jgi:hypothetical protein
VKDNIKGVVEKMANDIKDLKEEIIDAEIEEVETDEERRARMTKEIEDGLGKLEEHVMGLIEAKKWAWLRGFGAGYTTAIAGIAGGYLLSKAIDKYGK